MASCEDWQLYFNSVLRYARGVGSVPGPFPEGEIPEGCSLSPCDPPSVSMGNAIDAFRNAQNDIATRSCSTGCGVTVTMFRSNFFGFYQTVIRVNCEPTGEPIGCSPGAADWYVGDDGSCILPDPPPEPPPVDEYSTPLLVSITGGPLDGTVISSETVYAPTAPFYTAVATSTDCICELLGAIHVTMKDVEYTRDDKQTNFQTLIDALSAFSRAHASAMRFLAVAMGGVQLDRSENPIVGVLDADELQTPD